MNFIKYDDKRLTGWNLLWKKLFSELLERSIGILFTRIITRLPEETIYPQSLKESTKELRDLVGTKDIQRMSYPKIFLLVKKPEHNNGNLVVNNKL